MDVFPSDHQHLYHHPIIFFSGGIFATFAFVSLFLFFQNSGNRVAESRRWKANRALNAALNALDALSQGRTNDCVLVLLSSDYVTTQNKSFLARSIHSEQGRNVLAPILINDVFFNAIPDIMGNSLESHQKNTPEEISGYVAVLCKRDLITCVASNEYQNQPLLVNLHNAWFTYMEMSVMKHVDPNCDVTEFEKRIKSFLAQFPNPLEITAEPAN